ncbi:MAG: glycosyltransferase family 2 protein [Lachnospiraceae bacterium]|nr:glycosyltransferase family 2 protein [Lachnospiraceae bacterium]
MEQPLVSVIIPIYNREQTLERCFCSLIHQTYKNIEIIAVDDGSTDHTWRILEKYEKLDDRIRIIRKANSGVSDSRNRGMEAASGEYFQFVDSDDWLPKDATQTLVEGMLAGADMVIADYYRVVGSRIWHRGHISEEGILERTLFAGYMMKAPANFYYGVMWNKMYRADIIRQEGLECSKELDWCEDFRFNLEYLQYVVNVCVTQKPVYYYVKTKGSLIDTKVDMKQTIRTKRILFEYYKELYQILDMYEANRLKIQSFFIEFARDKNKGRTNGWLERYLKERSEEKEREETKEAP